MTNPLGIARVHVRANALISEYFRKLEEAPICRPPSDTLFTCFKFQVRSPRTGLTTTGPQTCIYRRYTTRT